MCAVSHFIFVCIDLSLDTSILLDFVCFSGGEYSKVGLFSYNEVPL